MGCFQGEAPEVTRLPPGIASAVTALAGRPGWTGREGQTAETSVDADPGLGAVALRGLGKRSELDAQRLRCWLAGVSSQSRSSGFARLGVSLPGHAETSGAAAAERVERQLMTCGYRFDRFLGSSDDQEVQLRAVTLLPPDGEQAVYEQVLPIAEATARAVVRARDLGNTPGNVATTTWMEERARELAAEAGLAVTVLDEDELRRRGMGGILAVGAGSEHRPRLVRLEWGSDGPVVALVGKGITFDTGGISIKPAASMEEMKYDKCGACNVLATATAVAELGLPLRLRVYLPLAENMPDGRSYRPGDIVTCYNGKTVEIHNTDAEGRMILADALALAAEEGAETLIEYSTLTGACVIALGLNAAGLYSPDDELAGELLAAADRGGELLWRLPLWPEFVEAMKGTHADLKNHGGRWGSANAAAAFLSQFVAPVKRWAHVDIAGPASSNKNCLGSTGATGFGIALAVGYLRSLVAR